METKHQVFVSSTYKDLIEERKEVIHALLELDCIPAGMELFPAADEDAWSLIKEIIDGCDYYLLILAGKYGSTNSANYGYTEMEFDYAASLGKPIISFIYTDVEQLAANKVESSDNGKSRLVAFRAKAEAKHCKYWNSAADLGGKVSRSLVQLKKKHPSDGWVPGRYAADGKMLSELEKMRARIVELELELQMSQHITPLNMDLLERGEDTYPILQKLKKNVEGEEEKIHLSVSWDRIFKYCGAALGGECSDTELVEKMHLAYWHAVPQHLVEFNSLTGITLPYVCRDQIRVQLQALGLMECGVKKRAVSDRNTYWKLTAYGEKYLIVVSARTRQNPEELIPETTDF